MKLASLPSSAVRRRGKRRSKARRKGKVRPSFTKQAAAHKSPLGHQVRAFNRVMFGH